MFNAGYSVAAIQQRLKEEDVIVTKRSLYRLIKKFKEKGVYTDLQRRARDKKLTPDKQQIRGKRSISFITCQLVGAYNL